MNSVDGLDIPETVIDGWKDAIVFSYSVFVNGEKVISIAARCVTLLTSNMFVLNS